MPAKARFIRIAHAIPGRIRFRLSWLRDEAEQATTLADRLAALPGIVRVTVRPRTGSVLCEYDPERTDERKIVAVVRRETSVTRVVAADEADSAVRRDRPARNARGTVARSISDALGGWNQDLLETTEGRLDLGSATALGLLSLGVGEILTMRQVSPPPWFNLAWWAFRTLTIFDDDEEAAPRRSVRKGVGRAAAGAEPPARR